MIALPLNDVGRARLALVDAIDKASRTEGANTEDPHSLNRWSAAEVLRRASGALEHHGVRNARALLQEAVDIARHLSIALSVEDLIKAFEAYVASIRASTACHICDADKGASCTVPVRSRADEPMRQDVAWVCADRAERAEVVR